MKKTIQKPENWQDFESLCKKLWGEIWGIPMKIKKNGRSGQPQAGVDIYGVPKDHSGYWGIQCKGKDEYSNAKLSKKEIDVEIKKAKNFNPKLEVFIFATSMNKTAELEEYVRVKDIANRAAGGFEILLYCWEDIADLIEENRDTYNWYVNSQHKSKYDLKVYFNDFLSEFIIKPKCIRTIRTYRVRKKNPLVKDGVEIVINPALRIQMPFENSAFFSGAVTRINEAICTFEVVMANEGSVVIEDWRVILTVSGEHKEIMDQLGTGPMGMFDLTLLQNKRTYIKDNQITYFPKDNNPLIQKDNRFFKAYIIPECREYTIPVKWELLARDYNTTGTIYLKVEPQYEDKTIIEYVDLESDLKHDEIVSIVEKKNYRD